MNKKIIKIIISLLALLAVIFLYRAQEGKTMAVYVARHNLPEGYTLTAQDVEKVDLPVSSVPQGAFADTTGLVGETLSLPRTTQDVILRSHLGGRTWELAGDERAIGIEVTDSAGLAGLLKPGDYVGVNAVINGSEGSYAKVVTDGLRVLYISPTFLAEEPKLEAEGESLMGSSGGGIDQPRDEEGVVILAVPVARQIIAYNFTDFGVESKTRPVNVIELLSALDHAAQVDLSLFMDPDQRESFLTSGVHLPDLVITPDPSPTPTQTPTPTPDWEG